MKELKNTEESDEISVKFLLNNFKFVLNMVWSIVVAAVFQEVYKKHGVVVISFTEPTIQLGEMLSKLSDPEFERMSFCA